MMPNATMVFRLVHVGCRDSKTQSYSIFPLEKRSSFSKPRVDWKKRWGVICTSSWIFVVFPANAFSDDEDFSSYNYIRTNLLDRL